jgi:hypothetical protein
MRMVRHVVDAGFYAGGIGASAFLHLIVGVEASSAAVYDEQNPAEASTPESRCSALCLCIQTIGLVLALVQLGVGDPALDQRFNAQLPKCFALHQRVSGLRHPPTGIDNRGLICAAKH